MDWWRRLIGGLRLRRREAILAEELEEHRRLAQAELERSGLTSVEAARESRRRMGNVTLAREDAREVWIVRWADRARQYVRHGIRGLLREPAFACTAILTLGLGTGATTTVFSVVDAEIWRPLPYPEPHRLVAVTSRRATPAGAARASSDALSSAELVELRSLTTAFVGLAAEAGDFRRRTVRTDRAESMLTTSVTANYFELLGRPALLGRVFSADDARGSDAVVLGERGWRRVFDASPSVVGRAIFIDDTPRVIVGVVAIDDTRGPDAELFVPIDERALQAADAAPISFYGAIGRLLPNATADIARDQVQAAIDRRAGREPASAKHVAEVEDLSASYTRNDRRPMFFFLGASILVMVLTVVNVAGLLLSRMVRRLPEFALRGALGGGARAILMQLGVESALIAIPGSAAGLLLAYYATRLTTLVVPPDLLLRGTQITVDLRVVAFSFAIAMATAAGLVAMALRVARRADAATLGSGGRTSGGPSAGRARTALLSAQIALTVVLMAGAGLFLKSFVGLMHVPLGFDPGGGWSMHVALNGPRYTDAPQWRAYADEITRQAQAIPGVRAAAVATSSPLRSGNVVNATVPGVTPAPDQGTRAIIRSVGPAYFRAIGTPLTRGRAFLDSDVSGSTPVVIVNEALVRNVFPDVDPVGRDIDLAGNRAAWFRNGRFQIVGVAANIKEVGLHEVSFADVYVPFAQLPTSGFELIVRGNGADAGMPRLLRDAAAVTDPAIPVVGVSTLNRRVELALAAERFNLIVVAGFAVLAVLMAAIGIYGAMAYAAAARRREFGMRLALGATPGGLVRMSLWSAARLATIGGAAGVAIALGIGLWIGDALYIVPGEHNGLLFGVRTTDPMALASALLGIVVVALAASILPARRVARINPAETLRS